MKNTYTIKEEKVYVVCKNGKPDKSFPTLEKAEKYKSQKEEEDNGAKKFDFKTIVAVVLLSIAIIGVIIAWCFRKCGYNIESYFIALFCGLIIGSCTLYFLIKFSIEKKLSSYWARLLTSFVVNMSFSGIPMAFAISDSNILKEPYVLISSLIIFIATFVLLSIFIKIKKEDDISLLKATNYLVAFLFTAIKLFKEISSLGEKDFLISYYLLLPLLLAQALYELFDEKSRKSDDTTNTEVKKSE